ncbi:rod-binding protein [Zavarzinella formosa]|uniref:rod-binding protein n=1 Tax=Zavarzinella formosa TaxID=360055 RepID=UPI000A076638
MSRTGDFLRGIFSRSWLKAHGLPPNHLAQAVFSEPATSEKFCPELNFMSGIQANSSNALTGFLPLRATNASLGKDQKHAANMAKDFESLFLSVLLKGMRQTLEPDSLFPGDSGDVMGGLFDQFMGQHLANAGGVGLAATIQRQTQQEPPPHVDRTGGTRGNVPRSSGA